MPVPSVFHRASQVESVSVWMFVWGTGLEVSASASAPDALRLGVALCAEMVDRGPGGLVQDAAKWLYLLFTGVQEVAEPLGDRLSLGDWLTG